MDKLIFLLIIAGIGVVLLVAMFTYYRHHKKINDEIASFNHHAHDIDDVLLKDHGDPVVDDTELPGSFSASRNDNFDIEQVSLSNDSTVHNSSLNKKDERELVDGVYINTKRVIRQNNTNTIPSFKTQTDTFAAHKNQLSSVHHEQTENTASPAENSVVNQEAAAEAKAEPGQKVTEPCAEITTSENITQTVEQAEPAPASKPVAPQQNPQQSIKIMPVSLPEGVEDLIISHSILAKDKYFSGTELYRALEGAGLQFGEMNIYHYPGDNKPGTWALFSVANIVEPGTFDPDPAAAEKFTTPGISLFMRLPVKTDNYQAYEKLLEIARKLADELGGELCDETRSQLTRQAIGYKKEQIRKLNFEIAKAERLAGMAH